MRNDTKWKTGSLSFVAIVVFIGHWLDFFLMVKPGVLHTAHEVGGHGAEHGAEAAEAHGHAAERFIYCIRIYISWLIGNWYHAGLPRLVFVCDVYGIVKIQTHLRAGSIS